MKKSILPLLFLMYGCEKFEGAAIDTKGLSKNALQTVSMSQNRCDADAACADNMPAINNSKEKPAEAFSEQDIMPENVVSIAKAHGYTPYPGGAFAHRLEMGGTRAYFFTTGTATDRCGNGIVIDTKPERFYAICSEVDETGYYPNFFSSNTQQLIRLVRQDMFESWEMDRPSGKWVVTPYQKEPGIDRYTQSGKWHEEDEPLSRPQRQANESSATQSSQSQETVVDVTPAEKVEAGQIKFSGDELRYPRASSISSIKSAMPELACTDFTRNKVTLCSAKWSMLQLPVIQGLPGACDANDDVDVSFAQNKVIGTSCAISRDTAEALEKKLNDRYGLAKIQRTEIMAMIVDDFEWKSGADYISIVKTGGFNYQGSPIDKIKVSIGTRPGLTRGR